MYIPIHIYSFCFPVPMTGIKEDKLDHLTLNMLSPSAKAPKLKAYAAECRTLVPVAERLAEKYLDSEDHLEGCVLQATRELAACYRALSSQQIFGADLLADHCRRFCILYVSIEEAAAAQGVFRVKPKLHLFQELCEMEDQTRPTAHWTYRDEDFGGSMTDNY